MEENKWSKKDIQQWALHMSVLINILLALFLYSQIYRSTKEEFCRYHGIRTIGFFDYEGHTANNGNSYSVFIFEVKGIKYEASLSGRIITNNLFVDEGNKIPIAIAYDESDPARNICLPEEKIKYKKNKILYYKKNKDSNTINMVINIINDNK